MQSNAKQCEAMRSNAKRFEAVRSSGQRAATCGEGRRRGGHGRPHGGRSGPQAQLLGGMAARAARRPSSGGEKYESP
eukprot:9483715-Pyramimonas_sp.AAC.1